MNEEVVIEVRDLVKDYDGFKALKGVSFDVRKGEVFGLLGENGAGKTTILEIIEGLRKPSAGSTRVFGLDSLKEMNAIKERMGVQLQASAYFENLTLSEILDLFGSFYLRRQDPAELLAMVNLEAKAKSQVRELSGGQAQRFSLVAALVNDPEIVFFDEPTTGLDPLARQNIWELIRRIEADGRTVILTSHYLEEVESLCGRVGILKQGELVALDQVSSLVMKLDYPLRIDFMPRAELPGPAREALEGLGKLEASRSRAGDLTLFLKDDASLKQSLRKLDEIDLERLTVATASLEDVFVKLTGETIKIEDGQ